MALRINEEDVTDDVLYGEFDAIKTAYEEQTGSFICCEKDDEFHAQARENLITRVLLSQQAKANGHEVSAEQVDEAFAALKQEHGGDEQFYANFQKTEEDDDELKRNVELNLKIQQLLESVVGDIPQPGDQELQAYYEEHIQDFTSAEQVKVSHILKSLQHGEDRMTAYQELCDARQQLLDGAEFGQLCQEHSDKPEEDGDLGFFARGDLVEEFEAVCFSMNEGEVSPIFTTPFGYHVVKMFDRKPAAPIPLDEIRDDVTQLYLEDRRQAKVREYVKGLEAKATIEEWEEEEPMDWTPDADGDSTPVEIDTSEQAPASDIEST